MGVEISIAIIIVLILFLGVQIRVLFIIKRLTSKLFVLTREVNTAKIKLSSKSLILYKTLKTCQTCHFRQTFLKLETDTNNIFFYRCKVNGINIELRDSCNKFELETTKI